MDDLREQWEKDFCTASNLTPREYQTLRIDMLTDGILIVSPDVKQVLDKALAEKSRPVAHTINWGQKYAS